MKQTFQEFLMRESAINALERISTKNLGQWFEINEMEFSVDKSTIHQDNLLGYAKTREDAQKLMKFMRKKGLIATRTGACGILVLN